MTLALRPPADVRVVWDGQSHASVPAYPNRMPDYAMAGINVPFTVVAVGGAGWDELDPTVNTRLFDQVRTGKTDVLVMCAGGIGDIFDLGYTGAQTYTAAVDYKNAAVAAGFDACLITTTFTVGPAVYAPTAGQLQAIADYNALVLANSGAFDAVVDITAAPLNDPTNSTYFDIDQLHLKATGAAVAGGRLTGPLETLIASL